MRRREDWTDWLVLALFLLAVLAAVALALVVEIPGIDILENTVVGES